MTRAAQAERRPVDDMILIEHLPFETDGGIATRARIGLIVLATDYTIEDEWRRIYTPLTGVALYQSRILNDVRITPETLRAMEPRIALSADVILPGSELDVVAYGCTSASMAIGEEKVFEKIRSVRPGAKCTTPITAAFAAFRAMGAKRIGVLTPYRADVNRIVADYIRARGFDVPAFGSFNEENDGVVAASRPNRSRPASARSRRPPPSMRYSSPVHRCDLPPPRRASKQRSACRSPPPIMPWPGMHCGLPALTTPCRNGGASSHSPRVDERFFPNAVT